MKRWFALPGLAVMISSAAWGQSLAEIRCGPLQNAYGPFDFRTATVAQKDLVQNAHFTLGVEHLQVRKTGPFGHDIGYTLRAFPNHPRALVAMQRLAEKEKHDPPDGAPYTVECFYDRALRFQPNDSVVRLLYANYALNHGNNEEATRHLEFLSNMATDDALTLHNVGLLYFDMGNYPQALAHEHRARALGMQRDDLKQRLQKVNQWVEPTDEAASSPGPASPTKP